MFKNYMYALGRPESSGVLVVELRLNLASVERVGEVLVRNGVVGPKRVISPCLSYGII